MSPRRAFACFAFPRLLALALAGAAPQTLAAPFEPPETTPAQIEIRIGGLSPSARAGHAVIDLSGVTALAPLSAYAARETGSGAAPLSGKGFTLALTDGRDGEPLAGALDPDRADPGVAFLRVALGADAALDAGSYRGYAALAATVGEGDKAAEGVLKAPLLITVRHGAVWPLLILAFGFLAGALLTRYRNGRLEEDEARVAADELRLAVEEAGFSPGDPRALAIADLTRRARASLAAGEVAVAKELLEKARARFAEALAAGASGGMEAGGADSAADRAERGRARLELSRTRLAVYKTVSFALAVLLVVAFAFYALYVQNPTFGEDLFVDYITLFLVGFGAQPTPQEIGKLVSTLHAPGVNTSALPSLRGGGGPS